MHRRQNWVGLMHNHLQGNATFVSVEENFNRALSVSIASMRGVESILH